MEKGSANGSPAVKKTPKSSAKKSRGPPQSSVDTFAVQCNDCFKWRTLATEEEFEEYRSKQSEDPFVCSKLEGIVCDNPADIEYDSSRTWVMDKPTHNESSSSGTSLESQVAWLVDSHKWLVDSHKRLEANQSATMKFLKKLSKQIKASGCRCNAAEDVALRQSMPHRFASSKRPISHHSPPSHVQATQKSQVLSDSPSKKRPKQH